MQNDDEMIPFGLSSIYLQMKVKTSKHRHLNSYYKQDEKLITQRTVLNKLLRTVEKRGIPEYYAFETMRRILKRNKWLYSYKHQIIELIWVLTETNDVRFKKHIDYFCKEIDYIVII